MTNFTRNMRPLKEYLGWIESLPDTQAFVCNSGYLPAEEVRKTKQHILDLYQSVASEHVFVSGNNAIYDVVPFEAQPAVRNMKNKSVPKAPDLPGIIDAPNTQQVHQHIGNNFRDELDNQISVADGMIGMRRMNIDTISKFGSLKSYLDFGAPMSASQTPRGDPLHKYGVGEYTGTNYGHSAKHAVYFNPIDVSANQGFSLTQSWALARVGNPIFTQSVEPCIQTFPVLYGPDPVLCFFATRDGYVTSVRDFELPLFVQTSNKWVLTVPIKPLSVIDGDQYYIQMAVKKDADKWWVYIGGETSEHAVGYYPTSYYAVTSSVGLATSATHAQFGGEVLFADIANTLSPAMGSGRHASEGWKKSSYVKDIKIFNTTSSSLIPTLQVRPNQTGYSAQRNRYAAPWNETLWFGGPGAVYP